ncbi:hypothetical protein [Acetobacter syzygii]|uniref:hypothetical protein n=1 Tax=Acetobacter syzygii TaxID=146476 RepID=UPI0039EA3373
MPDSHAANICDAKIRSFHPTISGVAKDSTYGQEGDIAHLLQTISWHSPFISSPFYHAQGATFTPIQALQEILKGETESKR